MDKKNNKKKIREDEELSRREFLIAGGSLVAGSVVSTYATKELKAETSEKSKEAPKAKGHIEHNASKCSGCLTCMIACSLAHEGVSSIGFSRLQISRYVFDDFPNDIMGYTCQQCENPGCVENCPTGACHIDTSNGNVRVIDKAKCIGCKTCLRKCNFKPHRTVWNSTDKKSSKCDLCTDAPYAIEKGSPSCVAICPQKALKFVEG